MGSALAVMVTVLNSLLLLLARLVNDVQFALLPGQDVVFGVEGYLVHPQLPTALEMSKGTSPVFLNLNTWGFSEPCSTWPKSCSIASKRSSVAGPS